MLLLKLRFLFFLPMSKEFASSAAILEKAKLALTQVPDSNLKKMLLITGLDWLRSVS